MAFIPRTVMRCKNGQVWTLWGTRRSGEWLTLQFHRMVVRHPSLEQRYVFRLAWNGERFAETGDLRWARRFLPDLVEALPVHLKGVGKRSSEPQRRAAATAADPTTVHRTRSAWAH